MHFWEGEVTDAARVSPHLFRVFLDGNRSELARKLLIATGVQDQLPKLRGIEQFWGTSVLQCPYCEGWEFQDAPIAVYGKRLRGFEMARAMSAWTSDIVLCSDGRASLKANEIAELARNGIELIEDRIAELSGCNGQLEAVVFRGGRRLQCRALFFDTPCVSQSRLAVKLGCRLTKGGGIRCGQYEATDVPGVFVAGNIIDDVQLAIVAAAEGARAAFGINRSLTREDFDRRATGVQHVEHPPVDDENVRRRRPQT